MLVFIALPVPVDGYKSSNCGNPRKSLAFHGPECQAPAMLPKQPCARRCAAGGVRLVTGTTTLMMLTMTTTMRMMVMVVMDIVVVLLMMMMLMLCGTHRTMMVAATRVCVVDAIDDHHSMAMVAMTTIAGTRFGSRLFCSSAPLT